LRSDVIMTPNTLFISGKFFNPPQDAAAVIPF